MRMRGRAAGGGVAEAVRALMRARDEDGGFMTDKAGMKSDLTRTLVWRNRIAVLISLGIQPMRARGPASARHRGFVPVPAPPWLSTHRTACRIISALVANPIFSLM